MRIVKDFKSNDSLSANPKRVTGAFLVSADCKGLRCVDTVEPLALKLFHLAQSSRRALHHIIPRWSRKTAGGSVLIWVFAFILAGAGIWFWHIQRRIEAGWFRTEAALNNVTEAESRLSLFLAQIFVVNIPIEIQGDRFLPNRIKVGRWNTELPRARPDLWRQNKFNSSFLQIFWLWRQRILSRNLMLSDRYFLYPGCGFAVILNVRCQPENFDFIWFGDNVRKLPYFHYQPSPFAINHSLSIQSGGLCAGLSGFGLRPRDTSKNQSCDCNEKTRPDVDVVGPILVNIDRRDPHYYGFIFILACELLAGFLAFLGG